MKFCRRLKKDSIIICQENTWIFNPTTDFRSVVKSVPEAIIAFLASDSYESAVRHAVALGGDADTQAAIAGSIAAAYYGEIPESLLSDCIIKLPDEMKIVINKFDSLLEKKYGEQTVLL